MAGFKTVDQKAVWMIKLPPSQRSKKTMLDILPALKLSE